MPAAPFLFGKLPSHGDFVSRGLAPAAVEAWDAWASAEIEAAQGQLADGFDQAHDRAFPCRFVAAGRGEAPAWRAGALAPSIDSAGRRFVIVLGFQDLAPAEAGALGVALAERSEQVLRRALVAALSADETLDALAAQAPLPGELAAAQAMGAKLSADGVWWRLEDASILTGLEPPAGLLAAALGAVVQFGGAA